MARELAEIDADIARVLAPYDVTLEQLLPLSYGTLQSMTPMPPGRMDARDYLEQLAGGAHRSQEWDRFEARCLASTAKLEGYCLNRDVANSR